MTEGDLADLVETAVRAGPTDADDRIYRPGDWPAQPDDYPLLKLRILGAQKRSLTRSGGVQFETTVTIRIIGEVSAPVSLDDQAGASAAEAALLVLGRQVEVAVIGSHPLATRIQQIASVTTQFAYNGEGATHLAGIAIDFTIEFYQGPEDFAELPADDLDRLTLGTHLDLDLQ